MAQNKKVSRQRAAPFHLGVRDFAYGAAAKNTRRAYQCDWKHFEAWCSVQRTPSLPVEPESAAAYAVNCVREGLKISTVRRRLAAIGEMHLRNRHPSPLDSWEVRSTLRRLRNEIGTPPVSKKPLSLTDLRSMLEQCAEDLSGMRDRAVLIIGFCSALKRSELVHLTVEDIAVAKEGLVLNIRGNPSSRRKIALPFGRHPKTCPVKVLEAWLAAARIERGPIFRAVNKSGILSSRALSDRVIGDIVKKYCARIGRRPSAFSGYSLRTGFAIAATQAGASQNSIRRQTGHASLEALRRYTGDAAIFQDHAMKRLDI